MRRLKKAFQFWFWETARAAAKAAIMRVKTLEMIGPGLLISTIIGVSLFYILKDSQQSAIDELYTFGAFVVTPAIIMFLVLFLYEYFCAPAQLLDDWHLAHGLKEMGQIVIDLRKILYSLKHRCENGENVKVEFNEWKNEANIQLKDFPPIFIQKLEDESMGGVNQLLDAHSSGSKFFKRETGYGRESEIENLLSAIRKREYALDVMVSDISHAQLRHIKNYE